MKTHFGSNREFGLSLVLATLGRTNELLRFFESLKNSNNLPVEVVLVDQNEDARLEKIVQEGERMGIYIKHLHIAPLKGLSIARNHGLKAAKYALVGFPDDDCWYEQGVCDCVLERFSSDADLDGLVVRWAERHKDLYKNKLLNKDCQLGFRGVPIASICLFFRTDLVLDHGGFDESLGVGTWAGSSEETDLVFKVLAAGATTKYCADVSVRHSWSSDLLPVSGGVESIFKSAISRARGTGVIYYKHSIDLFVVFRGLLSPLVRTILFKGGFIGFVFWFGTTLGRLQGYFYALRRYG